MTLRESFNNAVRSDRPESPTDIAFLFLVFILGLLWIFATATQCDISAIVIMVAFIGSLKVIKVGSDYQKQRKAACDGTATDTNPGNGTN
jgi:hypothetical protein